jgi:D-cysteine desulfhydrase
MAPRGLPERLPLARLPTPIMPLTRASKELGVNLWIWRDDMTGFIDSGNKLRKLEFLAADAVAAGATRLITAGGPQSNHARATVYVARRLGLDVSVVVREPKKMPDCPKDLGMTAAMMALNGNLLLTRIAGADITFVPYETYVQAGATYEPFLAAAAAAAKERGERPYVIGEGGSVPVGTMGYVHAVDEMLATWRASGPGTKAPDSLFLAVGSGGTLAGLALGYERHGLPADAVHAVNVCDDAAYFQRRCGALMAATADKFGLAHRPAQLSIHDGFVGRGYGLCELSDLRTYAALARQEGVLLDPVYTGKAWRGMVAALKRDPGAFGQHVLFLHSGGGFGTFAYAIAYQEALESDT